MKFAGYKFDGKFTVVKNEDLINYLREDEISQFFHLLSKVAEGRLKDRKDNHGHLVVSIDEEYAPEIADIIAEHHDIDEL